MSYLLHECISPEVIQILVDSFEKRTSPSALAKSAPYAGMVMSLFIALMGIRASKNAYSKQKEQESLKDIYREEVYTPLSLYIRSLSDLIKKCEAITLVSGGQPETREVRSEFVVVSGKIRDVIDEGRVNEWFTLDVLEQLDDLYIENCLISFDKLMNPSTDNERRDSGKKDVMDNLLHLRNFLASTSKDKLIEITTGKFKR